MATFSTNFDGSENPLRESALWVDGITGIPDCQKLNGVAQTTVVFTSGTGCLLNTGSPGATIGADQYSKGMIGNLVSDAGSAVFLPVRFTTSADGYWAKMRALTTSIYKVTAGSAALLGDGFNETAIAGDIFEMRVTGTTTTTLEVFKNGVSIGSRTDTTSPYTSGQPGIIFYGIGAQDDATLTSWEGGDYVAPAVFPAMFKLDKRLIVKKK